MTTMKGGNAAGLSESMELAVGGTQTQGS